MHDPTAGFGGVDWATDAHAVCVVDGEGRVVVEFDVAHTADGLAELCRRVERAGGPPGGDRTSRRSGRRHVLDAGLEVVVVSSRSVKALRERYGTSGNKSDRSDAYVLADCLRTDGHRWRSLEPDSPGHGHPARPCPGPQGPRRDPGRGRQPTPRPPADRVPRRRRPVPGPRQPDLAAVSRTVPIRHPRRMALRKRLGAWLRANGYCGRKTRRRAPRAASTAAPSRPHGDEGDARGAITLAYVTVLKTLRTQIDDSTPASTSSSTPTPTPNLPIAAPLRHRPRRHPARRDRRLPRPVPRPRIPLLPRRRRTIHPRQRTPPHRHVPLQQQQETPRRPLRLRRRQLARQPLGRHTATATPRRRQKPPPRRTHPRPQLDPHHLALLARPHALRPHPPRRPPTPHPRGGLT